MGPLFFVIVADRWYIPFEEGMMRATFGSDYVEYCKTTRRWL